MSSTYTLLQKITVGASGPTSITFNNIPQTYTDLVIRCSARDTYSGYYDIFVVSFNGSSSNFSFRDNYAIVPATTVSSETGAANSTGWFPGANAYANTFGVAEFFIPNYTSSKYKAYNYQTYVGGSTTGTIIGFGSANWRTTSAITSVTLATYNSVAFSQYSTFYLYGVSSGTSILSQPKAVGGDIIRYDGTYWYHAFLSSGTFKPLATLSCDYLVVAGGGGAGYSCGGGGGAGGLRSTVTATGGGGSLESSVTVNASTTYPVLIGAGGPSASGGGLLGVKGGNSVFGSIVSTGGGGGGSNDGNTNGAGGAGGSGGGAGGGSSGGVTTAGAASPSGQGYAGGTSTNNSSYGGAGGGGAGAVGQSVTSAAGGNGGTGLQLTAWSTPTGTGASGYYAGGGGGGNRSSGSAGGTGGSGGGGNGGGSAPTATIPNTGGGAGSNANNAPTMLPGASGIVIVRYAG
jgi:hypothetical protein